MTCTFALLIPVFNEETTLNDVLERAIKFKDVSQIILVDDGSLDNSPGMLRQWQLKYPSKISLVFHPQNQGKGSAIRSGIEYVRADVLFIQDADLEYDINDLEALFEPFKANREAVVFGSRFLTRNPNLYWTYLMGNRLITKFINFVGRGHLTDSYTCYKGMTAGAWKSLNLDSHGFEIEAEISMKCLLNKWPILEKPIQYHPRSFEQGKKIRALDALIGMLKALYVWQTWKSQ